MIVEGYTLFAHPEAWTEPVWPLSPRKCAGRGAVGTLLRVLSRSQVKEQDPMRLDDSRGVRDDAQSHRTRVQG